MANSDGQVKIIISTNANEAAKALDNTSNAFNKAGKSAQSASNVFDAFQNEVDQNVKRLRDMALAGGQNSAKFKQLAKSTQETQKMLAEANRAVEKATQDFNSLEIAGINVSNALKAISAVAIARTLSDIGKNAIQTAGEFEQLQTSFKVMAGGAEAGEQLTNSLIDLASHTPMTTQGLARATRTLLSFGESSENVIEDLKLLGNISGGEEQRFQSLALAFAQVGSTGRLMGQDLLQMVNQGFNPLQIISEKTGKSMATLKKEMEEGKISFDMVKQAMVDATSEGGRFYGLMEEQSQTLNGRLSTLSDNWDLVNKEIGDEFLPYIKAAVDEVIVLAANIKDPLTTHLGILTDNLNLVGEGISGVRDFIGHLIPGTNNLSNTLNTMNYNLARTGKLLTYLLTPLKLLKGATLKEVTVEFQKLNAQMRGLEADYFQKLSGKQPALDFSQQDEIIKKYKNQVNGVKTITSSAKNGFNSSGGLSITGGSGAPKQIKDDYEKLQAAVQAARREVELAAIKYGTSSDEVRQKFALFRAETEKLQSIEKIFDVQKIEQPKTKFEELNTKIAETRQRLQELYLSEGQSENFFAAKNQLVQLETTLQDMNTAISSRVGLDWENISNSIRSNLSSAILTPLQEGESAFNRLATIGLNAVQLVGQEIIKNLLQQITLEKTLLAIKTAGRAIRALFSFGTSEVVSGGIEAAASVVAANGAAFNNGNVIPFAKGGVVTKPTVFPMANGGTGLMGEAGAEAVMPLRRMSNGRLGVEASNGNDSKAVQVNIYNQSNSQVETRKRDDGSMDIIIKRVNEALMNERTSSGFRAAYQREDRKGLQAV